MQWQEQVRLVHRTFYVQALWTYEKMLTVGYLACIAPFAKRWFPDEQQRRLFLSRNLNFFNTHPYMASWVIGAVIKIQETEIATGEGHVAELDRFKKRMSEALGAIGDQLFWNTLKPVTAVIGVVSALYYGVWGILVFLLLYNIPHLYHRIGGVLIAYREGFDIIKRLSTKQYNRILKHGFFVSAFLVGICCPLALRGGFTEAVSEKISFCTGLAMSFLLVRSRLSVSLLLLSLMIGGATIGYLMD